MTKSNKATVRKLMNNINCSLFYVNDLLIGFSADGYARIGILISFELNHLSFLLTSLAKKNITDMDLNLFKLFTDLESLHVCRI